jgi:hypothetical protein
MRRERGNLLLNRKLVLGLVIVAEVAPIAGHMAAEIFKVIGSFLPECLQCARGADGLPKRK